MRYYLNNINKINDKLIILIRQKKIIFLLVAFFAFIVGFENAYYTKILVRDDAYFGYYFFDALYKSKGFWKTIGTLLMNHDLIALGEFRTYGISKVVHFLIHFFVGSSAPVYQFIISSVHILSSILIYKLLSYFTKDTLVKISCCVVYALNPFYKMQCFHYFSYVSLPFYLLCLYILYEVKITHNTPKRIFSGSFIKSYIIGIILLITVIFTGESTLITLGFTITIFICYGIINKKKKVIVKYFTHLCLMIGILGLWRYYWSSLTLKTNGSLGGRFNNITITNILKIDYNEIIKPFIESVISILKWCLLLDNEWKFNLSTAYNIHYKMLWLIIFSLIIMISVFLYINKDFLKVTDRIKTRMILLIWLFILSLLGVHILSWFIFQELSLLKYHLFIFFSLMSVGIILSLFNYLPRKIAVFFTGIFFITCIGYNVIWNAYLRPHIRDVETEVFNNVQKAKDLHLKNLVLFIQSPTRSHLISSLVNMEFAEPETSLRAEFSIKWFLFPFYRNVFFVYANDYSIIENDNNTFTISSGGNTKTFENDKTFFIYPLKNISSNYKIDRYYYFSYEDFKAASVINVNWRLFNLTSHYFYTHSNFQREYDSYLTHQKDYFWFFQSITRLPLLAVNCGILEEDVAKPYYPDKYYYNTTDKNINYGFLGDSNIYHYYLMDTDRYLYSYRYGKKFSYKFSGLPEEKRLSLYIDILELWAIKKGERIFSIEIETAQGKVFYRDIDPFDIANNFLSNNKKFEKKLPFRIYFDLPCTSEIVITFTKNEEMQGYSLPYINGIGLIEEFNPDPYINEIDIVENIYSDILDRSALIFINAGSEMQNVENMVDDAAFTSNSIYNGIHYGHEGQSNVHVYGDGVRRTNRYGASFSYRFENIPQDRGSLSLVLISDEIWKSAPGEREFSVTIETDNNSFIVEKLDPYLLKTKKGVFTFDLPSTSTLLVTFNTREDLLQYGTDSLAFINLIGLVPK